MVGKQVPVTIYELLGNLSDPEDKHIAAFATALSLYREQQWEGASTCFADILNEVPEDRPSKIYFDRCEYFKKNPPAKDWDGVFNRTDK
jgi:adenylate cyclase